MRVWGISQLQRQLRAYSDRASGVDSETAMMWPAGSVSFVVAVAEGGWGVREGCARKGGSASQVNCGMGIFVRILLKKSRKGPTDIKDGCLLRHNER